MWNLDFKEDMKEEGELFEVGPGGVERRMREGDGDEYD
jgi:hypothetical protein